MRQFQQQNGFKACVIFDEAINVPELSDDYEADAALVRFSQDKNINTNGRKLLDFCKFNGLRICNGRFWQDKVVGKYTYIGSTGSSVVDCVIMSPSLIECLSKFYIDDPNILSDHCTVYSSLTCLSQVQLNVTDIQPKIGQSKKYIWNPENAEEYMIYINFQQQEFFHLQTELSKARTGQDIDENISEFINVMSKIRDPHCLQKPSE